MLVGRGATRRGVRAEPHDLDDAAIAKLREKHVI